MGSPTAMLVRKMPAAKSGDNRQIADGNIALLLLPLSEDALNPFQSAANRGRGNLRKLAHRTVRLNRVGFRRGGECDSLPAWRWFAMPKPYSLDLRARVVRYAEGGHAWGAA